MEEIFFNFDFGEIPTKNADFCSETWNFKGHKFGRNTDIDQLADEQVQSALYYAPSKYQVIGKILKWSPEKSYPPPPRNYVISGWGGKGYLFTLWMDFVKLAEKIY